MKRILRLSTLAGAIVAAVTLTSLAPGSRQTANAQVVYRTWNGGSYYSGGYAPGYGGNAAGYGYNAYGYGGYTYVAPPVYVYPSYRSRGLYGNGYRTGGMYNNGLFPGSQTYGLPSGPVYSPYGYGVYAPYGS